MLQNNRLSKFSEALLPDADQIHSQNSQRGFSLIELAIVLCGVGFLILSTINGKELYASAQAKAMANELKSLSVSMSMFQDKYRALPGDDANTAAHFNTDIAANATSSGNGDNIIDGNWLDSGNTSEASRVWLHLRLGGFERGSVIPDDVSYMPRNHSGGLMGIQNGTMDATKSPIVSNSGNAIQGRYVACSRAVSGKVALNLDFMLDDGNPGTGRILATSDNPNYQLGATAATLGTDRSSDINNAGQYIVCMGL